MKKAYSVLFIGNSYTYYNDMPTAIFKEFMIAAGYDAEVEAITKGSHTLSRFADPSDEYGKKVYEALSNIGKYDFVVLQEQSIRPIGEEADRFYNAVRELAGRIRKTGATPILYSTWGRKAGSPTLETYGWTNRSMALELAESYNKIGGELNIQVAHAGLSFLYVTDGQDSIELYDPDRSHPSYEGSYLAAATVFCKIFGVAASKTSYIGNLSPDDAKKLCEVAEKTVFG